MRVLLICPDAALRNRFQQEIEQHPNITLCVVLNVYPSPDELSKLVQRSIPEVAVISMEGLASAESVSAYLEKEFPLVQRVAIHSSQDSSTFRQAMWFRMCELIAPPFESAELQRVFGRLRQHLHSQSPQLQSNNPILAFVPAKAGVGASTIAAHTAWTLSQSAGTSALLADFDTSSGMAGFMFNAEHGYSLKDALHLPGGLDEDSWKRIVRKVGKVDLLLSGTPLIDEPISRERVSHVLAYARRNYDVVAADLPDSFNDVSLAVLQEATRIFLVVTPELPALRLALIKLAAFRKLELDGRVSLLVNRLCKQPALPLAEIEKMVGLPVYASFPNHYFDVERAILSGQPASRLAPSIQSFVQKVMPKGAKEEKRPRFFERFALAPLGQAARS
jgi:pilus assembly protein CpaE